ncbi:hypothetical protein HDU78_010634 [Chytriomyces hyalinus]|nr:hypothetical protein HDU78_010634 [Chytriomyces hyalinus]
MPNSNTHSRKEQKLETLQMADMVINNLKIVNARYIISFVNSDELEPIYFNARQKDKSIVGKEFVWIGTEVPFRGDKPSNNARFASMVQGFILVTPLVDTMNMQYQDLNATWNQRHLLDPSTYVEPYMNISFRVGAFDCVNTLIYGLDKLLKSTPESNIETLFNRDPVPSLTPKVFSDTGYKGAYATDMVLNPDTGDLVIPYQFFDVGANAYFAETNADGSRIVFTGSIIFNGGDTFPPDDGRPQSDSIIQHTSAAGIAILSLMAIGILLTVTFAVVLYAYRSHPTFVKAAPIFSGLMLFGILISFLSPLFVLGKPNRVICHLRLWSELLGFIVTLSALWIKNSRIHIIFSSRTIIPKSKLSNARFAGFMLVFIALEIALLTSWSIVVNPRPTGENLYDENLSYQCNASATTNPSHESAITTLLFIYNAALLIMTLSLGYLTRRVNSEYNESGFMLFYVLAASFTSGASISAMNQEADSERRLVIRAVSWLGFTAFVAVAFFGPKVWRVLLAQGSTERLKKQVRLRDMIDRKSTSTLTGGLAAKFGRSSVETKRESRCLKDGRFSQTSVASEFTQTGSAAKESRQSFGSVFKMTSEAFLSYEMLAQQQQLGLKHSDSDSGKLDHPKRASHAKSSALLRESVPASFIEATPKLRSSLNEMESTRESKGAPKRNPSVAANPKEKRRASFTESLHSVVSRYKYEILGHYDFEITNTCHFNQWSFGEITIHSLASAPSTTWVSVEINQEVECFVVPNAQTHVSCQGRVVFVSEHQTGRKLPQRVLRVELESENAALKLLEQIRAFV